ncbi:hypothetical protein HAX54_044290 [Datura stramonium]|uniref:Uncharacterized protein n=1 Tax=Datura stramonium TaxID=4076 RepID=A0ABS8W4K0_DATST|nr:hypothetical protein [Datura stramonium]
MVPNNEQISFWAHGQLTVEEKTLNNSGHNGVPCGEFDLYNARKKIPCDADESDDEGRRNRTDITDMSLEEMTSQFWPLWIPSGPQLLPPTMISYLHTGGPTQLYLSPSSSAAPPRAAVQLSNCVLLFPTLDERASL